MMTYLRHQDWLAPVDYRYSGNEAHKDLAKGDKLLTGFLGEVRKPYLVLEPIQKGDPVFIHERPSIIGAADLSRFAHPGRYRWDERNWSSFGVAADNMATGSTFYLGKLLFRVLEDIKKGDHIFVEPDSRSVIRKHDTWPLKALTAPAPLKISHDQAEELKERIRAAKSAGASLNPSDWW